MIALQDDVRVYIYPDPVDMRKAIGGLSAIVSEDFREQLCSGDVFVFTNRMRNKLKILFWDRNGFVLYYKRLERHRFKIPKNYSGDAFSISHDQLSWLLAGLDFILMNDFSHLNYRYYY